MQTGADEEKVREVPTWRESGRFSPLERAALEYAEAMTITGQRVSDELFARLRTFFDEAQIVELSAAVALENFRSKLNPSLGIEAQGFCHIPLRADRAHGGSPQPESVTSTQPDKPPREHRARRAESGRNVPASAKFRLQVCPCDWTRRELVPFTEKEPS